MSLLLHTRPLEKGHPDDAAYDLRAVDAVHLLPGERRLVPTDLRLAIPEGYAGLVLPRSGLALKHGVTVLNAPGLIDPGYRGEVGVILINLGDEPFHVKANDRVAQLLLVAVAYVVPILAETLPPSARGEGGFGSTGVG